MTPIAAEVVDSRPVVAATTVDNRNQAAVNRRLAEVEAELAQRRRQDAKRRNRFILMVGGALWTLLVECRGCPGSCRCVQEAKRSKRKVLVAFQSSLSSFNCFNASKTWATSSNTVSLRGRPICTIVVTGLGQNVFFISQWTSIQLLRSASTVEKLKLRRNLHGLGIVLRSPWVDKRSRRGRVWDTECREMHTRVPHVPFAPSPRLYRSFPVVLPQDSPPPRAPRDARCGTAAQRPTPSESITSVDEMWTFAVSIIRHCRFRDEMFVHKPPVSKPQLRIATPRMLLRGFRVLRLDSRTSILSRG